MFGLYVASDILHITGFIRQKKNLYFIAVSDYKPRNSGNRMNSIPLLNYRDKTAKIYKSSSDKFVLLFLGDTSFGENYQEKLKKQGKENILEKKGYQYPLEKMKQVMTSSDFVVSNLETPITDLRESPYEGIKSYIHCNHINHSLKTLIKHNISLVSLANNHTFDFGQAGFNQTLNILKKNELPFDRVRGRVIGSSMGGSTFYR